MPDDQQLPTIRLQSSFGFGPNDDGYIGWLEETNRQHVIEMIAHGDPRTIYEPIPAAPFYRIPKTWAKV